MQGICFDAPDFKAGLDGPDTFPEARVKVIGFKDRIDAIIGSSPK